MKKYSPKIYNKNEVKLNFAKLSASIKRAFYTLVVLIFLGILSIIVAFYLIDENLPKIDELKFYEEKTPTITNVFSYDGEKIGEFYKERRVIVLIDEMPKYLPAAFIAAEDSRFYEHKGIDLKSIFRAFTKNLKAGKIVQGGSTITQQVAKNFFLNKKKIYIRKVREAILAYKINKQFSKKEVLFLYLNKIYLGHRSYGVAAAAQNYFQKDVKDLNLAECAMLGGLPKAPSRYSPFKYMDRAKKRQKYVLKRMLVDGYITREEYDKAILTKIVAKPIHSLYHEEAPYFTEYVRQYIEMKYGLKALYEGGLQVYTTVDKKMQNAAKAAVKKGLKRVDKRMGYRGAITNLNSIELFHFINNNEFEQLKKIDKNSIFQGVVTEINTQDSKATIRFKNKIGFIDIKDMRWARKPNIKKHHYSNKINKISSALKVGDVILLNIKSFDDKKNEYKLLLSQKPFAQSALLCIEAGTGYVKSMIGGRKFIKSQFNRAIQSKRQPGSAFKPIIYAAALDKGYTTASIIADTPITFQGKNQNFVWKPKNYEAHFFGYTTFREALVHSRNIVTVKILQKIGIDYVRAYAKKLGINSNIKKDLSIALGSSGISLLEMVKAYSVFANKGELIKPIFITKILDKNGNILEENKIVRKRVIEKSTAYIITNLLESVVKNGTGKKAMALKKDTAGKTGTTNNLYDAWFIGYTPQYITGVWTGLDSEASMGIGETGAKTALPIWLSFMKDILSNKSNNPFEMSKDVVFKSITISTKTKNGKVIKKKFRECFKDGSAPTEKTKIKQDEMGDNSTIKDVL